MSEFTLGDTVIINNSASHLYNCEGDIIQIDGDNVQLKIRNGFEYRWYRVDELRTPNARLAAPTAASATSVPEAGEADEPKLYQPNADLPAHSIEYWPKMFRERIEWKGFYNEHAKNDMMDAMDVIATLETQLAETRARLAAVEGERDAAVAREKMLLASLHNIQMQTRPTGNDDYDVGRRAGYNITTELARAAISAHAKALAASEQAAPGEGVVTRAELDRALQAGVAAADKALALESKQDAVRIQLGNMLFNLKQQPDMKRVTDSIESIMDSVGWDKS